MFLLLVLVKRIDIFSFCALQFVYYNLSVVYFKRKKVRLILKNKRVFFRLWWISVLKKYLHVVNTFTVTFETIHYCCYIINMLFGKDIARVVGIVVFQLQSLYLLLIPDILQHAEILCVMQQNSVFWQQHLLPQHDNPVAQHSSTPSCTQQGQVPGSQQ